MVKAHGRDRGAVLIAVLIMAIVVAVFCVVSLVMSGTESRAANNMIQRDQALFIAQAGVEDELFAIANLQTLATLTQPFVGMDPLSGTVPITAKNVIVDCITIGQYTVSVDCVTQVSSTIRDVQLTSTAYMPSATATNPLTRSVTAVIRFSVGRSHVFDYVYFINNWGWFYGNSITANGNVCANGQFDFGGYSPSVNGIPVFASISSTGVPGTQTDCGGVYSGWNIVNNGSVKGSSNGASSMHAWGNQIQMPNLTDLTAYQTLATTNKSSITVCKQSNNQFTSSTMAVGPVVNNNLYLEGDGGHPITINGPVVVNGNVIISGVVKGQGAIYASGSIYVVGNLSYSKSPSGVPNSTDYAKNIQSWYTSNTSADALGLFARQNIIIGDYTDSKWQSSVGSWMTNSTNYSGEDVGMDGIPNTKAGKDGILGTADDDTDEMDGKWEVSYYKAGDALPTGKKIGDVIAGSGEDIDGDGQNTPATTLNSIALTTALTSSNWAGNFPTSTITSFSNLVQVANNQGNTNNNNNISQLNAAFYTNHTLAMYSTAGGVTFNGCVVSHNEDLIFTNNITFNYDPRLQLATTPFGLVLPMTWQAPQIMMWRSN